MKHKLETVMGRQPPLMPMESDPLLREIREELNRDRLQTAAETWRKAMMSREAVEDYCRRVEADDSNRID